MIFIGHPKKQRIKYDRPFKPYDKARIEREKKLVTEYGLKRKNEVWRAEALLRSYRRRARELLVRHEEQKEKDLIGKLNKLGIKCIKVEDVLGVKTEDILSRRLQTVLHKKYIADVRHSRQLIVHGHVSISGRRMLWPGYLVTAEEESTIQVSAAVKTALIDKPEGGTNA